MDHIVLFSVYPILSFNGSFVRKVFQFSFCSDLPIYDEISWFDWIFHNYFWSLAHNELILVTNGIQYHALQVKNFYQCIQGMTFYLFPAHSVCFDKLHCPKPMSKNWSTYSINARTFLYCSGVSGLTQRSKMIWTCSVSWS